MSEHRIEKIESLIHQVLGEMIQREFTPPEGALVSLTRIAASGNLQEAKVYISVIPDRLGNEVVGNLQKNAWRFQEELNKIFKDLERNNRNNKFLKITYNSERRVTFINNPLGQSEEWEQEICFLQVKIPHFCKTFSPGTSGEFLC